MHTAVYVSDKISLNILKLVSIHYKREVTDTVHCPLSEV